MRQGASVGSVSSPGHRATGLGSWRNLECGMDEDEWMRMFVFALVGSSGRGGVGWID